MKEISLIPILFALALSLAAQSDTSSSKLVFNSDFRFRVEQDWNSKKSDGSFRDDRTRLRYRIRAGVQYSNKWYSTGFQVRTGNPRKQQDPQLTLGDNFKEFGTLPIGLDKAYFQGAWKSLTFSLGKYTFPFEKNNELFWSDNVNPEGLSLVQGIPTHASFIDSLNIRGGHFIISTVGQSLSRDSYFQGLQIYLSGLKNRLEFFPAFYVFKNMPNIPDGASTYQIDYSILHLGARLQPIKNSLLVLEIDFYRNLQNYNLSNSIPQNLKNEKNGLVLSLKYGTLKQKGNWLFTATYAQLQRFAAVDFMAQNDWARWDYSDFGSPDGRLTNMQGLELTASYAVSKKVNLVLKYYKVTQLLPFGAEKETGDRIRLDLNCKF